jgi:hypothetical protein
MVPLIFAALPLPAHKEKVTRKHARIPTVLIWFSSSDRLLPLECRCILFGELFLQPSVAMKYSGNSLPES